MDHSLFKNLTAPNGTKFTQPVGLFINNQWVAGHDSNAIVTIDPSTESPICSVHAADATDVDDAVRAARNAFEGTWRDMDASERGELVNKLARLVEEHADTLATIETWDNGKTFQAARNEDVPEAVAVLKYYAGWADKITGQTFNNGPGKLAYTLREPLGVCGAIVPWNFPLAMAAYKLGPALAAGNTVVLKPAEQTPLSALYLATLVTKAGFPPGVINVVNGHGRVAGAAIVEHPGINKISFTGSTPTGKAIMEQSAQSMKRVTLETGGKSPMLIFNDADLEEAVKWAHIGIMSNQGQVCSATSRIFVQRGIYAEFLKRFKAKVESVKVGNPFDDYTFQGPQVTRAQFEKIMSYVEAGKSEGAELVTGGVACKNVNGSKGLFIAPTIFSGVTPEMTISKEEVFGPFVVVSSFEDEEEAVRTANQSIFGLASAIFTTDVKRAHALARRLETGTVWINSSNDADIRVPFGGYKQSALATSSANWEFWLTQTPSRYT